MSRNCSRLLTKAVDCEISWDTVDVEGESCSESAGDLLQEVMNELLDASSRSMAFSSSASLCVNRQQQHFHRRDHLTMFLNLEQVSQQFGNLLFCMDC